MYIYDPDRKNSFLTDIYFSAFRKQLGCQDVAYPSTLKNSKLIIHAENLTPSMIQMLKENGNKIIACDINDSSQVCFPDFWEVDLILKFAGLQMTRTSPMSWLDENLGLTTIEHKFMGDIEWERYRKMRAAGKIMSLPYIPWGQATTTEFVPYDNRRQVLVRGGNHLMRFVLYLHLAAAGLIDEGSQFFATHYLGQHCDECRETYSKSKVIPYVQGKECPNQPEITLQTLNEGWRWNNRCIPRFYWLAEQFQKGGRQVDFAQIQGALHGRIQEYHEFYETLAKYRFYADHKLIFSIYAPPRFWEAASVKTVNLVPRRTNSQFLFPYMEDGAHYLTFSEDLSDIQAVIEGTSPEQHRTIQENAYDLYMRFIARPRPDLLATELIEAIRGRLENV